MTVQIIIIVLFTCSAALSYTTFIWLQAAPPDRIIPTLESLKELGLISALALAVVALWRALTHKEEQLFCQGVATKEALALNTESQKELTEAVKQLEILIAKDSEMTLSAINKMAQDMLRDTHERIKALEDNVRSSKIR